MKTIYFKKLPKCDYRNLTPKCQGDAVYDALTINGQWAHMCEYHYQIFKSPTAERIGCKLAQRDLVKPKEGKAKMGIEPSHDDFGYWENVLMDGLREIRCPDCNEPRSMEPDAEGIFNCEGCGIKVKCPMPII